MRQVPGGAVRRRRPAKPKVAVLAGGGSGHYPAFAGLIGTGLADGAVVGNIFTSPSAQQAYAVAKAAESGAGVVFTYGNYAGDVLNFGMASERLAAEGIQVENVLVTDDIASAPPSESEKRRGIAGDFTVFKIMGAAAEAGADLADVVRLGRKANSLTRTIGSAFHGCTFPGADAPLFTLKDKQMGLGLGIHGEPGLFDTELPPAKELGQEFVSRLLAETPARCRRPHRRHPQRPRLHQARGTLCPLADRGPAAPRRRLHAGDAGGGRTGHQPGHVRRFPHHHLAGRRTGAALDRAGRNACLPPGKRRRPVR